MSEHSRDTLVNSDEMIPNSFPSFNMYLFVSGGCPGNNQWMAQYTGLTQDTRTDNIFDTSQFIFILYA